MLTADWAASAPVGVDRGPAAAAAARELAKPIYQQAAPPWWQRALGWLGRTLAELLNRAAAAAPGGGRGLALLVLAALVILGLLIWRVGRVRTNRSSPSLSSVFGPRRVSAAEYARRAETAFAAGDYPAAVTDGFRALALELDDAGLVDLRPGMTADELAGDAAAARVDLAGGLADSAAVFDAVVYGDRVATAADVEVVAACRAALRRRPVSGGGRR